MNRLSHAAGAALAALLLTGCMDSGISACHDELDFAVVEPSQVCQPPAVPQTKWVLISLEKSLLSLWLATF